MSEASMSVDAPKLQGRSRLTNGAEMFLAEVDGRSRPARRFRDVFSALVVHLGGESMITEPRRHLAKRAAALVVHAEMEEAKLATEGAEFDVATHVTATNALRRVLLDLGLDPAMRDVTPTLAEYLATRNGEAA